MTYFAYFPKISYTLDEGNTYQALPDITERVIANVSLLANKFAYSDYVINEGETPRSLADNFYNNEEYDWVITIPNNIIDPVLDWPLTQLELQEYCNNKYSNSQDTHHYEDPNRYIVDSVHPTAVSISNFEYEDSLNEKKRYIKILNPRLVNDFVKQFKALLK